MQLQLSLAYLTTEQSPPQAVQTAARSGFHYVGIRLLPAAPGGAAYPLMSDPRMLRETMACKADTGVRIADLEMIRLDEGFDIERYLRFMEVGALLEAKAILVAGDDRDASRLTANFARLCETAAGFGLTADLEFMPWTGVKDLATARRIVETADHPAAAVLFDTLHFDRCGSTLAEFADLPPGLMNYIQVCDGPVPYDTSDEALIRIARTARMIPGEGGIDLASITRFIPEAMTISVEVPNHDLAQKIGPSEVARCALAATKELLND